VAGSGCSVSADAGLAGSASVVTGSEMVDPIAVESVLVESAVA
jgi:hypothetical protein